MNRLWLALLFAGIAEAQTCVGTTVNPGDNVPAIVTAAASGTTFCFSAGTYPLITATPITPKVNDVFTGAAGRTSIVSGAVTVTGFSLVSGLYVANLAQTHANPDCVNAPCTCLPAFPACNLPEDLFFDNTTIYQRVLSTGAVTAGKWYWDTAAGKVYLSDNPSGHLVEVSVGSYGFMGNANGVTVQGFTVQKFSGIGISARVPATASTGPLFSTTWTIDNNNVRLNHIAGISGANTTTITDNIICDNGVIGVKGGGTSDLVQNNEICRNNYAGRSDDMGGLKVDVVTGFTARGNFVHDNLGAGLHVDGGSTNTLYENNHLVNNQSAGIDHEISHNAIIRNNLLENEVQNIASNSFSQGAAIWISNSDDVEVYGNTVIGSRNSIGAWNAIGRPVNIHNLNVHNNFITQPATGLAAGVQSTTDPSIYPAIYNTWNNHFTSNQYCLTNLSGNFYQWNQTVRAKAAWQTDGLDTAGIWQCANQVPPGPPPILLSVVVK